jgi:transcriptional regulator with XRE-family HTH domain
MTEEVFLKKLANNISKIRKAKKLTIMEVASRSNMEKSNWVRMESAGRFPTVRTLFKVANGLEVEVKDLFDF